MASHSKSSVLHVTLVKKLSIFQLALFTLGSLLLAFLLYPGSTYYNHAAQHYQLLGNTISESGITNTYRHESNLVAQLFFSLGLICAAVTVLMFFRTYAQTPAGKNLGLLSTIALLLIPVFPSDLASAVHNYIFFSAVVLLFASFLVTALSRKSQLLMALSGMLLAYIAFLLLYPSTTISEAIHTAHIVLQKGVLASVFLVMILYDKRHRYS